MAEGAPRRPVVGVDGHHATVKLLRAVGQASPLRPSGERLQRRDVVRRRGGQPPFQLMDHGGGLFDGPDFAAVEGDHPDIHRHRNEIAVDLDGPLEALTVPENHGVGVGRGGREPQGEPADGEDSIHTRRVAVAGRERHRRRTRDGRAVAA